MILSDIDTSKYDTLFIDRDGTINRLIHDGYVTSWDQFEFLPNMLEQIAAWSKCFKYIIIITNQRGVGRGIMSEDTLNKIHDNMISEIEKHGGRIDGVYYCVSIDDNDPCRKPNTGMAMRAKRDFPDIDFSRTLVIGDDTRDVLFAQNIGADVVFVGEQPSG